MHLDNGAFSLSNEMLQYPICDYVDIFVIESYKCSHGRDWMVSAAVELW